MSFTLHVPSEYGYVVLTATSTLFLSAWHSMRGGSYRKAAGIPYPHAMASPEQIASATPDKKKAMYLFNCVQRAHGNFLENVSTFVPALLIAGLQYPVLSAGLGMLWNVSRVIYAVGYTREDKTEGRGRVMGSWFFLCQWALFALSAVTGLTVLRS